MLEVELKAWANLDSARSRLESLGKKPEAGLALVKEDVYYCAPDCDPRTCDPRRDRVVRIRNYSQGPAAIVTAKRKRIEGGVETSEEIELTVSSEKTFRDLLDYMGYRPFLKKRKESRAYRWDDATHVELNRIEGLGEFVEIESLLPSGTDERALAQVRAELRRILAALGIDELEIESRPYMDLLRQRGIGLELREASGKR